MNKIYINARWDDEAHVWVATSDDVLGLVAEASSRQELGAMLKIMIPELLTLNGIMDENNSKNDCKYILRQESVINAVAC